MDDISDKPTGENMGFSDIDSDDDSPSVIAHKDMSNFETSGDQNNEESKPASPADDTERNKEFDPVSPVSDVSSDKGNFETISPPDSPVEKEEGFENISDDEEDTKTNNSKNNSKSGTLLIKQQNNEEISTISSPSELDTSKNYNETNNKIEEETQESFRACDENGKKVGEDDDIEAPVPSPFSDIGDVEDIGTGTDSELISDIMKDTSNDFTMMEIVKQNNPTEQSTNASIQEDQTVDKTISFDDNEKPPMTAMDTEKGNPETANENDESKALNESANHEVEAKEESSEKVDNEEQQEGGENLIADIFGDSDEEEEEFQGFDDADIGDEGKASEQEEPVKKSKKEESSDDEGLSGEQSFVSDFDMMMEEKKKQKSRRRRKMDDGDFVNDNDDLIAEMIKKMKECAEEDKMLNQCGKAATKKLKMLQTVVTHLRKADLQSSFIDSGILPAMKEWLTPLPDHALPHVNIRKYFLKILFEFPQIDRSALKSSGIGRAVMLLFKHPKEVSENKKMAGKIINNWARPIFNVSTNFHDMSREDREQRDKLNLPESKRRRLSSGCSSTRNKLDDDDENRPRKPGDKGWIGRARVPVPSYRDYVNRPESKVDMYDAQSSKKQLNRYEQQARKMKDKRDSSGNKKAVGISLNGSKLAL